MMKLPDYTCEAACLCLCVCVREKVKGNWRMEFVGTQVNMQ